MPVQVTNDEVGQPLRRRLDPPFTDLRVVRQFVAGTALIGTWCNTDNGFVPFGEETVRQLQKMIAVDRRSTQKKQIRA